MSHECPNCGMYCYCNGDIDDCCFNDPQNVWSCHHCNDDDDDGFDLDENEPEGAPPPEDNKSGREYEKGKK